MLLDQKRCRICISNNRTNCAHRAVNDGAEIERKGKVCLSMLLQDFSEKKCMPNAQVIDMLPGKDVMCFSGFDADGERVFEPVQLKDTVSDSGDLSRSNIDYICNLVHTEESNDVSSPKTAIRLDPNEFNKEENPTNIDYVLSPSEKANCDNIFKGILLKELRLRGIRNLPTYVESRRAILRG